MKQNIKQLLIDQTYKIQKKVSVSPTSFNHESVVDEAAFPFINESLESMVFILH